MGAWIVAGALLLACWMGLAGARRRAARRAAQARARARSRRRRVPLVSANLRGQPVHKGDLWRERTHPGAPDEGG